MSKDDYLEKSVRECVEYVMKQNDETKRKILKGLFQTINRLTNENILVQALNDKEKQEWFNNEYYNLASGLQQKIDKIKDTLLLWGETLNPTFQKVMMEILGDKENE